MPTEEEEEQQQEQEQQEQEKEQEDLSVETTIQSNWTSAENPHIEIL